MSKEKLQRCNPTRCSLDSLLAAGYARQIDETTDWSTADVIALLKHCRVAACSAQAFGNLIAGNPPAQVGDNFENHTTHHNHTTP